MLFDFEKRSGQGVSSPKLIDQKKLVPSLNLNSNMKSGAISHREPREANKLSLPNPSPTKKAPSGLRTDLGTYFRHKLALQK
mmetsp:Transcript_27433/g.41709  ORF Transcript_27433/g.41709 Transcript_27433/m.41709 type:complete len:82 (-) Transcript_27433:442-687(-)